MGYPLHRISTSFYCMEKAYRCISLCNDAVTCWYHYEIQGSRAPAVGITDLLIDTVCHTLSETAINIGMNVPVT